MASRNTAPKFWQEEWPGGSRDRGPAEYVETPDFTKNNRIAKLNKDTFCPYIHSKEICMVMYYKPDTEDSIMAAVNLNQAAMYTKRPNSSYAVVNCKYDKELCDNIGFTELPVFRLYSRGHAVGTIRDFKGVSGDLLRGYVEMAPAYKGD